MKTATFYKAHQAGNDFLVAPRFNPEPELTDPALVRLLCHRHFGPGGDGIIMVYPWTKDKDIDFRMELYNSDGSRAELSGNGLCCIGKVLYDLDFTAKKEVVILTDAGPRLLNLTVDEQHAVTSVQVAMPVPTFIAARVPVAPSVLAPETPALHCVVKLRGGATFDGVAVNVGNPHFVVFCDNPEDQMRRYGAALERHPAFPAKVNVQFVRVETPDRLTVWPHERGAGPTLACGSGATAVVAAAVARGLVATNTEVAIHMPGGVLHLTWAGETAQPLLRGSPVLVAAINTMPPKI